MYNDDIITYTMMFYIHINIHLYLWWPYEPSVVRQMNTYDMMCQLLVMIVMMIWYIQWWDDMFIHSCIHYTVMMIWWYTVMIHSKINSDTVRHDAYVLILGSDFLMTGLNSLWTELLTSWLEQMIVWAWNSWQQLTVVWRLIYVL